MRTLLAAIFLLPLSSTAFCQQTPAATAPFAAPELQVLGPGLARAEGTTSGVAWTKLLVAGEPVSAGTASASSFDLSRPILTAQCTQDGNGKQFFEIFVNFGGVPDAAFYPPWHETGDASFPPRNAMLTLTMEFLGYTRVKPFKRQFERVQQPGGQLRYTPPGRASANMEPPSFFLQYLRSLPTLRISDGHHTADFATATLLARLHAETLCHASGM
jgi:hypothetical protein